MSDEPNPFEMQRRIDKATRIADVAEQQGVTADELADQWPNRKYWATTHKMKPASKETWDMAVGLLAERENYEGESGLGDPRVVQQLAAMAVRVTETLARHNVDSTDMEKLSRREKRQAARMAGAEDDKLVFDLASRFMEYREEHRLKGTK